MIAKLSDNQIKMFGKNLNGNTNIEIGRAEQFSFS